MGDVKQFPRRAGKSSRSENSEFQLLSRIGREIELVQDETARRNLTIAWKREVMRLFGQYLEGLQRRR